MWWHKLYRSRIIQKNSDYRQRMRNDDYRQPKRVFSAVGTVYYYNKILFYYIVLIMYNINDFIHMVNFGT